MDHTHSPFPPSHASCASLDKGILGKRTYYPFYNYAIVLTCFSALNCGSLAIPINGSSVGDLTTFPNKIMFEFDDGFSFGDLVREIAKKMELGMAMRPTVKVKTVANIFCNRILCADFRHVIQFVFFGGVKGGSFSLS